MFCKKCGAQLKDGASFCTACGARVTLKQTPEKKEENSKGFFLACWAAVTDLFRHPKKLIPTFVVTGIWLLFSLLSGFGVNVPVLRFFYTLTYANGGMFGGFFGLLGGIFGKAVFAAFVNAAVLAIVNKKNPLAGVKRGAAGLFGKAAYSGLAAIAPLLTGAGIGLLVYWLFNITASPVNSVIALVGAVGTLQAAGKQNGLLFSLFFFLLGKLSKNKAPAKITVSRMLSGLSAGFTIGFALTFVRFGWLIFLIGALLASGGIVLTIVGKNGLKKAAATTALLLMTTAMALSLLPVFPVNVSAVILPDDFVDPLETLDFSTGINSSLYDEQNTDAVYFDPIGAESLLVKDLLSRKLKGCGEYEMMNLIPTYTLKPMIVYRNEENDTVTATGKASFFHNGKESGWEEYQYNFSYTYELELDHFDFTDGKIVADVRGTETYAYGVKDPLGHYENDSQTVEIDDKQVSLYAYIDTDTQELTMTMYVGDSQGYSLTLVYAVEGIEPASGHTSGGTTEKTESDDYVPYRGRLTYNNGRTNKYGQPFPDLMDFDGDGDIDYADRVLQHELVHNPDYLDQPGSPAGIAAVALLTATLGGAVGAAAGTTGSAIGSAFGGIDLGPDGDEQEDLGRYIKEDADGDLNVTDPATGEQRLYKNNGDGTYTNPLTGATYTAGELKASLDSRAENAGLIRQDEAARVQAVEEQREENQKASFYDAEAKAEKAAAAQEEKHDAYVEGLAEKYHVYSGSEDDVREKIGEAQGKAEVEFYEHVAEEEELHSKQQYVETVEKAADTSIDVLADVTGRKDIKAGYTMLKNTAARTTEAVVNDKNVLVGMAQGAIEGGISVVQDNVDGAGSKLVANVVGETYKEAMDATINGKNMTEAVASGIGNGLLNTGVDVGMDLVGDGVKEMMGDAADDAIKNALTEGAEVTKGSIADGVKTLTGDLIKDGIEEATKMPGDDD